MEARQDPGLWPGLDCLAPLDACNIAAMELPVIGRYRRRFVVEFGPEEAGLVDRMGVAHRTKRAAIIAGLRLLESGELEQLRRRVADAEQELASAREDLKAARSASATATPEITSAKADLRTEHAAHRETKRALKEARAALTQAHQTATTLRAERDRLAGLLPSYAYCGTCDKLVPEAEWAEQPARNGVDVYHQPDGYRPKGGLLSPATVLFWRAPYGRTVR